MVERLRRTDAKRRGLLTDLEQVQQTRPPSSWRTIEQRLRKGLSDWRARLQGDMAEARAAFRELLTEPIRFTPFVERGYHAIRFEGRIGLAAVFGTEWVTNVASPTGVVPEWSREIPGEIPAVGRSEHAA